MWAVVAINYGVHEFFGPFEYHEDAVDFFRSLPDSNRSAFMTKSIFELKDPSHLISQPETLEPKYV